jgi:F-type H+-transporting ATPase subunit b
MMFVAVLANNYYAWWAAQVIAIVILVILFLRWRPGFLGGKTVGETLAAALDAREQSIQEQLSAAERSREEAARIREQSARDIEQARLQAQDIVTRAEQTSEAIRAEMENRAREEYSRIVGQAKTEIEYERERAEMYLRRRAADIVIDAAGQVVRQTLDPDTDRQIIDTSLDAMRRPA